jgi:hypothetical protein
VPTLPSLRKSFQRAIAAAAMTSPALGACAPGPGIEKDPDFVPITCQGSQRQWLPDLRPTPAVDFLELVSMAGTSEAHGDACKTASAVAACQAALATLRATPISFAGFSLVAGADFIEGATLNVTRGDDVFRIETREALVAFLAEIDTAQEAMLLTQAASYNVTCDGGGARPVADGFEVQAYRSNGCFGLDRFLVAVAHDGSVEELDREQLKKPKRNCAVGRRPVGLREPLRQACVTAGEYLARAATLEAASVAAFRRLAAELKTHGAPRRLIDAALAAAHDEVRHARVTARLARRLGAISEPPTIAATPARELEAIARENAVEGCVRETYGALEGRFQALRAADPALRRAYRRIAEDELRHAALSWRVARWIEPRLSASAQRRVAAARRDAAQELRSELNEQSNAQIRHLCGVPSAREAHALFASLAPTLV